MRFDLLAVLGSACFGTVSAASCKADNCYRQVAANAFPTRPVAQDCSSYLASTFTPSQITYTFVVTATQTLDVTTTSTTVSTLLTTKTDTVTSTTVSTETDTVTALTTTIVPVFPRVLAVSSGVPAYASGCTSQGQYSSACSCKGISPFTVTAATPSTTVTVTVSPTLATSTHISSTTTSTTQTLTAFTTSTTSLVSTSSVVTTSTGTSTISCSGAVATVLLRAVGGTFDGQYLKVVDDPDDALDVTQFEPSEATASTFVLDSSCHLSSDDSSGRPLYFAVQNNIQTLSAIYYDSAADVSQYSFINYVQCLIAPVTDLLFCQTANPGFTNNLLQVQTGSDYTHGYAYLGTHYAYEPLTLQAIYVV